MNCSLCGRPELDAIHVPHPFFRHMDFEMIRPSACLYRCRLCRLLQTEHGKNEAAALDRMYRGKRYARSRQTEQTVQVPEYRGPVTRSFLQADILANGMDREPASILDIGCFDGRLLNEFVSRFPSAQLHGFDVNEPVRRLFPSGKRFQFWTGSLENVTGVFDLVCLSHSLICIPDIGTALRRILDLLAPSGRVFIQLPDISKNPYAILFADQYTYFTNTILSNALSVAGFDWSPILSSWFPREILGIARPRGAALPAPVCEDTTIYGTLAYLNSAADQMKRVSDAHRTGMSSPRSSRLRKSQDGISFNLRRGRTGVLGTTLNAAWADQLCPTMQFFVDENPAKIGRRFRGKPVIHPESLKPDDQILLPYGLSGAALREKFEKSYSGNFVNF
ncbi:class I SAM-dependent methyltransferase [bacterium]|nr:class I SAM-dependent methyltransferase [bacterium]